MTLLRPSYERALKRLAMFWPMHYGDTWGDLNRFTGRPLTAERMALMAVGGAR